MKTIVLESILVVLEAACLITFVVFIYVLATALGG